MLIVSGDGGVNYFPKFIENRERGERTTCRIPNVKLIAGFYYAAPMAGTLLVGGHKFQRHGFKMISFIARKLT